MTDPMTGYEQAEADAVERQDEARREQHWYDAEMAARLWLKRWQHDPHRMSMLIRMAGENVLSASNDAQVNELRLFRADYGTPALLRVIATALEAK